MARKVIVACGGAVRGRTIALLGLTFKPNTDDMRDAPSIDIATGLLDAAATVRAYDPEGTEPAKALMPDVTFAEDVYACAAEADALVIVTEWNAFRALDFPRLKASMKRSLLIDLRNIYTPQEVERHGFDYVGVGTTNSRPTHRSKG